MSELKKRPFEAPVPGGAISGWISGDGIPALLLHGGPGASFEGLDLIAADIGDAVQLAGFQQRGLAPSTTEGPFTMAVALSDIVAVLDALGWDRALIVGHSWGGHLALRFAAAHPERLLGVLAIDALGVVGDGGDAAFVAELTARTPIAERTRATELDEKALAGDATPEEMLESDAIFWPAFYASPADAPPVRRSQISIEAYSGLNAEIPDGLEAVREGLQTLRVPLGLLVGAASPMPWGLASQTTADLVPGAWVEVVPNAGHMVWHEAPGCVRAAVQRLAGQLEA